MRGGVLCEMRAGSSSNVCVCLFPFILCFLRLRACVVSWQVARLVAGMDCCVVADASRPHLLSNSRGKTAVPTDALLDLARKEVCDDLVWAGIYDSSSPAQESFVLNGATSARCCLLPIMPVSFVSSALVCVRGVFLLLHVSPFSACEFVMSCGVLSLVECL